MPFSLTNEHYLVIPTSLAATLGLEEAVLLQLLADIKRFNPTTAKVLTLPKSQLLASAPFWDDARLQQVLASLQGKGVLEVTYSGDNILLAEAAIPSSSSKKPAQTQANPSQRARAMLEPKANMAQPAVTPHTSIPAAAVPHKPQIMNQNSSSVHPMTDSWQPRQSTYSALQHNHGVDKKFAIQQLDEFRIYWQDKGTTAFSWDSKFLRHVMHAFRNQEAKTAVIAQRADSDEQATAEMATQSGWRPNHDCMDILIRDGVQLEFIENTIPEFVLYWRERGENIRTWNSKFIQHVRRQWLRFSSGQVHDTEPHRIPQDWKPKHDTFDIIEMANIPSDFAQQQIPSFVLFWRESNQLHKSWNAKFLQHVKYQWAKQHQLNTHDVTNKSATGKDPRSFVEKHSDQSWADDL